MRLTRATILALGLIFGAESCTPPKFTAGTGFPGSVTPQPDTPPPSDTAVVPSSKQKRHTADVVLIYGIVLLVVAITFFKISTTDAH